MPIYVGGNAVVAAYVGSTPLSAIYLGDQQVAAFSTDGFGLSAETFRDFATRASFWTVDHLFTAADDLCIVGLSFEDHAPATVKLDPTGDGIIMSEICAVAGDGRNSNSVLLGVHHFSAQSGIKQIRVDFTAPAAGSMAVWTIKGAGRLPTMGDFASDGDPRAGQLALHLTVAPGEERGIMLGVSTLNGRGATTPGNIAKVHGYNNGQGGQSNAFYRHDGPLRDPEQPSISYGNARASFAALKVVPA
ncbi:MAG: hypothetical protein ACREH3_14070 [Geminicoccales bacterium]